MPSCTTHTDAALLTPDTTQRRTSDEDEDDA